MNLFSRFFALAAAVLLLLPSCHGTPDTPAPVNIIFETDMGNDIDDAMALDMLYKWVDEGKVNLLAIMINKEGTPPPEFVDIMNTFYGHQVPIGVRCGDAPAKTGGVNFAQVISDYISAGKTSSWHWMDMPENLGQKGIAFAFQKFASGELDAAGFLKEVQKITKDWYSKL